MKKLQYPFYDWLKKKKSLNKTEAILRLLLGISVEYYHLWRISPHKLITEQNLKQIWGRLELIPIKKFYV